jgi:hypothetical protein
MTCRLLHDPDVQNLFKELPPQEYHGRERISRYPTLARVNSYMKVRRRHSDETGSIVLTGGVLTAAKRKSSMLEILAGGGEPRRRSTIDASIVQRRSIDDRYPTL